MVMGMVVAGACASTHVFIIQSLCNYVHVTSSLANAISAIIKVFERFYWRTHKLLMARQPRHKRGCTAAVGHTLYMQSIPKKLHRVNFDAPFENREIGGHNISAKYHMVDVAANAIQKSGRADSCYIIYDMERQIA